MRVEVAGGDGGGGGGGEGEEGAEEEYGGGEEINVLSKISAVDVEGSISILDDDRVAVVDGMEFRMMEGSEEAAHFSAGLDWI